MVLRFIPNILVVVMLILGACSPSTSGTLIPLNPNRPIAQLAEGLIISANPANLTADYQLALTAISAEALMGGQAPSVAQTSFNNKPAHLNLVSALFSLSGQGTAPAQLFVSIIGPTDRDLKLLDLYGWNGEAWSFLPSQIQGAQRVAAVTQLPQVVGLFESNSQPQAMLGMQPGDVWPLNSTGFNVPLLAGGVSVQADGTLGGVLPNLPPGLTDPLYPVISISAETLTQLMNDEVRRAAHAQLLANFARSGNYAGIVLNYPNLSNPDPLKFIGFIQTIHLHVQETGKPLALYLDLPIALNPEFDGKVWQALGATTDLLLVRLPLDPQAVSNGTAAAKLEWITNFVERSRVRVVTSALPVVASANGFSRTDRFVPEGWNSLLPLDASQSIYPNQPVKLQLFNPLTTEASGLVNVQTPDGSLWLSTPFALRQRFALAEQFRLGGAVAEDVFHLSVPIELLQAVADYQTGQPTAQLQTNLVWVVKDAAKAVAQGTTSLTDSFTFTPSAAGDYQAEVQLRLGNFQIGLGAIPVKVAAEAVLPTATAVAAVITNTPAPQPTVGSGTPNPTPTPKPTSGAFVPPPPVANGAFELGGQVPGFIGHPAQMQQSGMKWVKFQVRGGGSDYIAAGKGAGFKVLLSVLGDKGRATDPAYWDEYAAWVAGLAAQGADAIEVWNEPNVEAEWPEGQINGATYTQLLAKAYAAIKAANPNTLVISASLAPTGAEAAFPGKVVNDDKYLAQMAAAGAANYMDCVGIHHNGGSTSPNATTGSTLAGYHYSYYFWPMVDLYYNTFGGSRQLCFTELGYVSGEGYPPLPTNFSWGQNITVAQQAQWLAEAASLSASSGKVRMLIVWNVGFTTFTYDPQAAYSIIRPDGTCPACAALDAVMP